MKAFREEDDEEHKTQEAIASQMGETVAQKRRRLRKELTAMEAELSWRTGLGRQQLEWRQQELTVEHDALARAVGGGRAISSGEQMQATASARGIATRVALRFAGPAGLAGRAL